MDFSFIPEAAAQAPIIDVAVDSYSTSQMIQIAISLMILVAGLCAVFFTIWGGLMLILSGGDDSKVKSAVGMIRYSIIGLFVIVVSIFVLPKFTQFIGLGTFNLSPNAIFGNIQHLTTRIFGSSTDTYTINSSPDFTDF